MKKVLVKLSSVEMVKDFNSKLFPLEGEFDLGTGHYIVDARSIMGIFSSLVTVAIYFAALP